MLKFSLLINKFDYAKKIKSPQSILLSFSVARRGKDIIDKLDDPIEYKIVGNRYIKNYQLEQITERSIFPTFLVKIN